MKKDQTVIRYASTQFRSLAATIYMNISAVILTLK